ncbi:MAG: 50S ribosomal protein L23 [Patescibacteria group bacterium]
MSIISKKITNKFGQIKRPYITEKATFLVGNKYPIYTFEVVPEANKAEVAKAIKLKYNVTPVKVNIVSLPTKKVIVRGKKGTKSAVKKAYVFLKPGDKIDLI